ncbi:MAG: hypothetical protein LBS90_00530 [Oscillospiraceae bacterium]|nr:hypothetical protein [Oscillospiraceae bacterium]
MSDFQTKISAFTKKHPFDSVHIKISAPEDTDRTVFSQTLGEDGSATFSVRPKLLAEGYSFYNGSAPDWIDLVLPEPYPGGETRIKLPEDVDGVIITFREACIPRIEPFYRTGDKTRFGNVSGAWAVNVKNGSGEIVQEVYCNLNRPHKDGIPIATPYPEEEKYVVEVRTDSGELHTLDVPESREGCLGAFSGVTDLRVRAVSR